MWENIITPKPREDIIMIWSENLVKGHPKKFFPSRQGKIIHLKEQAKIWEKVENIFFLPPFFQENTPLGFT